MKRTLICALIAVALPALAQVSTNPNAKVDPKNNKVSRPVVDKPKKKLMTRDELRACLIQYDQNEKDAAEISAAQASNAQERAALLASKEELGKLGDTLNADGAALKVEQAELIKAQDELKAQIENLSKSERATAIDAYKARAAAHDAKVDAYNTTKKKYMDEAPAFDARIVAHNESTRSLKARAEAHLEKVEDWKEDCSNKPYDENDEIAVRKELGQDLAKGMKTLVDKK